MSEQISLKQVERKAFRLSMEDGLLDIQIGLLILLLGAAGRLGETGVGVWIFLVAIGVGIAMQGLIILLKRAINLPRIGRIKYGPARQRRIKKLHWITFATAVATFVLMIGVRFAARGNADLASSGTAIWSIVIFFAFVVLGIFIGMSHFLDEPRLLLYGFMMFAVVPSYFALQEYTELPSTLPYFLAGAMMVVIGAIHLVRFLRKYPVPPAMDVSNGSR